MRVIAGRCRSLPLKTVPGKDTRPTTDRIKETLFNIVQSYVPQASVLDLFAGSGALGIEALSRGAAQAVFVDADRRACDVIAENLKFTHLIDDSEILHMQAEDAVVQLSARGRVFDLVFLDPPYQKGLERRALQALHNASCVHADTLYVVEAAVETSFSWLQEDGFYCIKEKVYKTNKHLLIKRETGETS